MTLLKVYNNNGHCRPGDSALYGNTRLFDGFPYKDENDSETRYFTPRVNISENKESFKIELEAPGIQKSFLRMHVSKDLLTISYNEEVSVNEKTFTYREFNYQNFERTFRLPDSIDKEKISASYQNGILYVNLAKKDEAIDKGPRSIEIS